MVSAEFLDQPGGFDAAARLAYMEAGQARVQSWLHDVGLGNKVQIGVVALLNESATQLDALVKVRPNKPDAGFFMHRELYLDFPSDHFKSKVMLVCG